MLAKTATSWEKENGSFSSAMTVMTMMTVFLRYTHNQSIRHIHRHDRHHRHWGNGLPPGLPGYWVRFGCQPDAAAVPPFSYKDVINDILAIVIIGDKDAVYDILARDDGRHKDIVLGYPWRQKPEDHPGAPAARGSIFGGPGRGPFPAKRQIRKHGEKDIPPFYISDKDSPAYLGPYFRIVVNFIIVNNFALVKTFFAKKLTFSLLLFWGKVQSR